MKSPPAHEGSNIPVHQPRRAPQRFLHRRRHLLRAERHRGHPRQRCRRCWRFERGGSGSGRRRRCSCCWRGGSRQWRVHHRRWRGGSGSGAAAVRHGRAKRGCCRAAALLGRRRRWWQDRQLLLLLLLRSLLGLQWGPQGGRLLLLLLLRHRWHPLLRRCRHCRCRCRRCRCQCRCPCWCRRRCRWWLAGCCCCSRRLLCGRLGSHGGSRHCCNGAVVSRLLEHSLHQLWGTVGWSSMHIGVAIVWLRRCRRGPASPQLAPAAGEACIGAAHQHNITLRSSNWRPSLPAEK